MNKIKYFLRHPKDLICAILARFKFISDKTYLKIVFRLKIGMRLDLNNPKSFNEKLQWLKINNRDEKYTNMVDKYEVKKIVSKSIGEEYVIPNIGIYDSFEEIDFNKLPNRFAIKCTHDSGGYVIVSDKKKANIKKIKKKINKSLHRNYYYSGREWPYKNIKPRIIIEEYMEDNKKGGLVDYKIHLFNGVPKIILVCKNRFNNKMTEDFFDTDWNHLKIKREDHDNSIEKITKPKMLKKMLEISKMLSKNICFLRIDFYEINGKIYFGEFTFFPASGFKPFVPEPVDWELGDMIDLKGINNYE